MAEKLPKIIKPKRPNGLSLDRYKGNEKWSYRRWAWEFLRRNDEFIRACDALDNKRPDERVAAEKEIAKKFHLSVFKHCNKGYRSKESPRPKFAVRAIKKIEKLDADNSSTQPSKRTAEISAGQVWLRFDLNHEFIVDGSLDAQLRVAKRSLKTALAEYSEAKGEKPAQVKKPERKIFLELLRRLDAVAGHHVGVQGLAALQPDEFDDLGSAERSKKANRLMQAPREYAKKVYLTLAICASK
jgi:hypothetical protein